MYGVTSGAGDPLREQSGHHRSQTEARRQRDGGAAGTRLLPRTVGVGPAGELLHPGRTCREDGPAAGAGQETSDVEQGEIVSDRASESTWLRPTAARQAGRSGAVRSRSEAGPHSSSAGIKPSA